MIVIKEKRNCGKTSKLVALLQKDLSRILLVFSIREAARIIGEYREMDLAGRVMSWDYYNARPVLWGRPLLIDNVEMFLEARFKSRVLGISINEDS